MDSVNIEAVDLAGSSMLEEIRRSAETRLQEIEPLIQEAERLRDVLSVITQQTSPGRPLTAHYGYGHGGGSNRAAKGANKRVILELVARRPGITAAEISQLTGVKRTVVASTVSRLKRSGELQPHPDGGVCVAPA